MAAAHGDNQTAVACSIASALAVLGDRWTLLILRDIFRGSHRFGDLQTDLGIAKNLLSDRLAKLVGAGIVAKVVYQERPIRYDYRLTQKGADLSPVLIALMKWGDRWYAQEGPPIELVHSACGHPLEQHVVCASCDSPLRPGQIRSRPGPGTPSEPGQRNEQGSRSL